MKTREQIKAEGFMIDDDVYPPLAYKGLRFNPTEVFEILTELEEELVAAAGLVLDVTTPLGQSGISEGIHMGMFKIHGNRLDELKNVALKVKKRVFKRFR